MPKIVLIHWNREEARERADRLRALGHQVAIHSEKGNVALRSYRESPPDAFVIDLERIPSQGSAVATFFRQGRGTRGVPIIFVGGAPEKVERVRALLPDAAYSSWRGVGGALRRALAAPAARPVVPDTMAGYSGTPLPKKLGIKNHSVVVLIDAPDEFEARLGPLPNHVSVRYGLHGTPDVILLFARSQGDLERRWAAASKALTAGGRLWVVWPKKTSSLVGDLGELEVRRHGLANAFVDYKVCAVDATWSGLCFARRRPSRGGAAS